MALVNRDKDSSEQKDVQPMNIQNSVTGEVGLVWHVPYPVVLSAAKAVVIGLSGAPTAALGIQRFIAGSGNTTIGIASALTLVAQSTSGPQSFSLSSTSLALQAGDVVQITHGASNAAAKQIMVSLVCQASQDVKSYY